MQYGDPAATGTTLTFDAEPLDTDQVVAGPVGATIYAKSSTRNLNLIATLNDVSPDGQVNQLVTGSLVGSLRAVDPKTSWRDTNGLTIRPIHPYRIDAYAKPNTLQRYDISLTPTLSSVASGHHLQLVLSSQPPASKCASLLSALTIPLPCLPSAPQQDTPSGRRVHHRLEQVLAVVRQRAADRRGNAPRGTQRGDRDEWRSSRTARVGQQRTLVDEGQEGWAR